MLSFSKSDHSEKQLPKTSKSLFFFIGLFAIGSWITINGLWVELPLLVQKLPEAWTLPSYIIIITEIANIGPLLYLFVIRKIYNKLQMERVTIYFILICGFLSALLLSQFWEITTSNNKHSIVFLLLTFIMSTVDCVSSVTFVPYMAQFTAQYMTALYIGEGFSGLLPGVVALIQGVGGNPDCVNQTSQVGNSSDAQWSIVPIYPPPRFSVNIFMIFLAAMLICSLLSFLMLDRANWVNKFRLQSQQQQQQIKSSSSERDALLTSNEIYNSDSSSSFSSTSSSPPSSSSSSPFSPQLSLYFIVAWINFLSNGFLPSLQIYTTLSYNVMVYHLVATLTNIINPIACSITFIVKPKQWNYYNVVTLATGSLLAIYLIIVAFTSPNPPLNSSNWGGALSVISWVSLTALFSYLKTTIAIIIRPKGQAALQFYGLATQIGSFFGALSSFLLVNVFMLFTSKPNC